MKTVTHNQNRAALLPLAILALFAACQQETAIPCPPGLSDVCYSGQKGTAGVGLCRVGVRLCFEHNGEIVERCEGEVVPAAEICDRADNDCNGSSDEGGVCNAGITTELEHHLDDLQSRVGSLWAFTRPGRTGPTLLTRAHWAPVFRCEETDTARQCADAFLRAEADALGIGNPQTDLEFSDEMALSPDSAATVFVRYRQAHAGHPVQSGGVNVRVRDHKVTVAEVYNVPILPDAATAAAISEADVVSDLPANSVVVSRPALQYASNDPTLPLETQTHLLTYLVTYERSDGEVYERVVDATTGAVLRDVSQRSDDLVLTVDGSNMQPAAGTPQRRVWDKTTDTYTLVNEMAVGYTNGDPITLVESDPNHQDSDEFSVTITPQPLNVCGRAWWSLRRFEVDGNCTNNLTTEHEVYHLVYGPYMRQNSGVADEEAIHHGFVDIGSLLVECNRQLAAGNPSCTWRTGYSSGSTIATFRTQGYAAAVPITTGMGGNWTDTAACMGNCQRTDNKLLFGAPTVRTLIRWGVSEENLRRLQYLMDATTYTLPNGGIRNMTIEEFAQRMIGVCYAASDDVLWGLNRERCVTLQAMFDSANVASFCELFSDEEFCNGADDNCDGYADNCLTADECCNWKHRSPLTCNVANETRLDNSLSSWCYGGSIETDGVGVCRAGFRTCDPAGMNSATWSADCNEQTAPAQEICDTPAAPATARDENCNGVVNEDAVRVPCVFDADGDGVHGTGPVSMRCACSGRWLEESVVVDCNDSNASVFPRIGDFDEGANALCNSVDDDCDGILDEGCPCNPLVNLPRPCGPESDIGPLCIAGVQRCMWDPAARQNRWTEQCYGDEWGSPEICNGVDDDCDGTADEPGGMVDIDTDDACLDRSYPVPCLGHFECSDGRRICRGEPRPEACNGLDDNCNGVVDDGFVGPESCDGVDNNCNGLIDEEQVQDCSNLCGVGTEFCIAGSWARCNAPTPSVEICDGQDNDCDGVVDNGVRNACGTCGAVPTEVCDNLNNDCDEAIDEELARGCSNLCGAGTEFCSAGSWVGCTAPTPSAEICNGRDDDCDGTVDNGTCTACVDLPDLTNNGDAFLTLTRGNREFGGNGPFVTVTVSLYPSGRAVCAEVYTRMVETRNDESTGENTRTVCSNAPGPVLEILTPGYEGSYTDNDHGWDPNEPPASGVVTEMNCAGDGPDDDICSDRDPPDCSLCHVYLGCVDVRYRYE